MSKARTDTNHLRSLFREAQTTSATGSSWIDTGINVMPLISNPNELRLVTLDGGVAARSAGVGIKPEFAALLASVITSLPDMLDELDELRAAINQRRGMEPEDRARVEEIRLEHKRIEDRQDPWDDEAADEREAISSVSELLSLFDKIDGAG